MTSIQQNKSINSFISQNLKSLFFVVIFLTLLFVGGRIFGASPFTDSFDTYSVGDLAPQGSWATTTFYSVQVSTTTSFSSPNSLWLDSSTYGIIKEGSHEITGSWSFWAKVNSESGHNGETIGVSITGIDYQNTASALTFNCVDNDCETTGLAKISVCIGGGAGMVEIDQIPINEWTNFQVEWDSSTNETRWKSDFGSWSNWGQCYTNTFTYVQGFFLQASQTGLLKLNLDSIGGTCSADNCGLCETYNTCVNGGCSWYYSIYLQDYFCTEPFTPDDEECDAFYKCQYCGDQTICEEQLNCQWIDRGYGDQCYMAEPTTPPVQEDWEIPDLEDCSGLSITETLLCEIKNLITGAVMPSQEKVESLYQTIGNFKEKFPFNYVSSLNQFFSDVAEDLEATSTIPIEILGATSTVSFRFWEATTTIGGTEETLKNVMIDFTTFVILIGWFVWLISLIKRFF